MKKFIVVLSVLLLGLVTQAQELNSKDVPALLDSLNREVFQMLRSTEYPRPMHIKAFNVLYGVYDGRTSKASISKGRFVKYVKPSDQSLSWQLMHVRADVLLCDADGHGFLMFDGYNFYGYRGAYLTEQMMRLGMRYVYCFANVCGFDPIYWGVGTDGESYVILPMEEQTFLVQDYPDELWDDLFQVKNDPQFQIERAKMEEVK